MTFVMLGCYSHATNSGWVLLDYKDNRSVMMISHTLGSRLMYVGQMINGGEGVIKMIQRLLSVPRTTTQSLGMNKEMVEICETDSQPNPDTVAKHDTIGDP